MSVKKSYFDGKKILAVDDEKDILEIIGEELHMADVDTALNYQTASEKIKIIHTTWPYSILWG